MFIVCNSNPERFEEIVYGDENSLRQSSYNPSAPTKVLIHGFQSSYSSSFPQNVKNGTILKNPQYKIHNFLCEFAMQL